jgi:transposase InsO family protein/transposase-like protein
MPWNERDKMDLKVQFIKEVLDKKATISELCREYEISRKTAYKWLTRYKNEGIFGLEDRAKRPTTVKITNNDSIDVIIETRNRFPAWGARKLRHYLINKGHDNLPSESTFNRTLQRQGLITKDASYKREHYIRFEREKPNELWQMDFKGHFQLEEGRCHPLTVLDDHSRFSICLNAYESEKEFSVRAALTEAFRKYGLPEAMTMDNGSPWKGSYPWRFSRLTIWLMRLGIKVSHSSPGHPQTQGKDERFHRSLKEEVLQYYQFKGLKDAQERFDEWRYLYNHERPHEGIGMQRPIDRYKPSPIKFPETLQEIIYDDGDEIRKVQKNGVIEFKGNSFFIGEHLYGERVAVRKASVEGVFNVYFSKTRLNKINLKT